MTYKYPFVSPNFNNAWQWTVAQDKRYDGEYPWYVFNVDGLIRHRPDYLWAPYIPLYRTVPSSYRGAHNEL